MDHGLHGKRVIFKQRILIKERLDKRVTNDKMCTLFPNIEIHHLHHTHSDHCPLLLHLDEENALNSSRPFHFEAWWILEESFETEIDKLWRNIEDNVLEKLRCLQIGLKAWAKGIKYQKRGKKEELTARFCELLEGERDESNLVELIDTKVHLSLKINKDERYWEQKERAN